MSTAKFNQWLNSDGTENYKCRAWVNFNGTGTVAIRAAGNVSSITDNGVGAYVINYTNLMPDAGYCVNLSAGSDSGTFTHVLTLGTSRSIYPTTGIATSSCAVQVTNTGGTGVDPDYLTCSVFRN